MSDAGEWWCASTWWCARCEKNHPYCECDEYAHLGTHSAHHRQDQPRPHSMDE